MRSSCKSYPRSAEGGFVLVLFALSLSVLIAGAAFLINSGVLMLAKERSQTATDLASLSATMRLRGGFGDSSAEHQARYVLVANDYVSGLSQTGDVSEHAAEFSPEVSVSNSGGYRHVVVSQTAPEHLYFSQFLGANKYRNVATTSESAFNEEGRPAPLNLVILMDGSIDAMLPIDPDCSNIPSYTKTPIPVSVVNSLTSTDCPTKFSVIQSVAKELIGQLRPDDAVTVFKLSAISRTIVTDQLVGNLASLDEIEARLNSIALDTWTTFLRGQEQEVIYQYETLADPSLGLFAAYEAFGKSRYFVDRNLAVVLITGATPSNFWDPYGDDLYFDVKESELTDSYYVSRLHMYSVPGFSAQLDVQFYIDNEIDSTMMCNAPMPVYDFYSNAFDSCANPTTSEEFSTVRARDVLQASFAARVFAVGVGLDKQPFDLGADDETDTRFSSTLINMPSRNRNYLAALAGDTSRAVVAPYNKPDSTGHLEPGLRGRFFEANSTHNVVDIARQLLNHAREGQAPDDLSTDPRLVR